MRSESEESDCISRTTTLKSAPRSKFIIRRKRKAALSKVKIKPIAT